MTSSTITASQSAKIGNGLRRLPATGGTALFAVVLIVRVEVAAELPTLTGFGEKLQVIVVVAGWMVVQLRFIAPGVVPICGVSVIVDMDDPPGVTDDGLGGDTVVA